MQVHQHRQEVVDEKSSQGELSEQGDDWSIEGLIFPQLIREGVGQRFYYCWTKTG